MVVAVVVVFSSTSCFFGGGTMAFTDKTLLCNCRRNNKWKGSNGCMSKRDENKLKTEKELQWKMKRNTLVCELKWFLAHLWTTERRRLKDERAQTKMKSKEGKYD